MVLIAAVAAVRAPVAEVLKGGLAASWVLAIAVMTSSAAAPLRAAAVETWAALAWAVVTATVLVAVEEAVMAVVVESAMETQAKG